MMDAIFEQISDYGIVPVVKIDKPEDAVPLGQALMAGSLPLAEITFRTAAAEESMRRLTADLPDLLFGAGTVLTTEQVDRAIRAGAKFIVAPGLNPKIVEHCQRKRIPVMPGVESPTHVEAALEMGLSLLKFFPAEASGGVEMLKALAGPFPDVRYVPTGGINEKNMTSYLDLPHVAAIGGSWMVRPELIAAMNFAEITRLTREAVLASLGFKFFHLGINETSAERASESAKTLADLFGFAVRETAGSFFADPGVEILKNPILGEHGHIAIQTSSVQRAVAYLKRRGFAIRPETARHANDRLTFVYLEKEVSGFAIHLIQK